MPTTVHIPDDLLAEVDRHARALKLSRNRFIVLALKRALEEEARWTPRLCEALRRPDPRQEELVEELLAAVVAHRSSKRPVKL